MNQVNCSIMCNLILNISSSFLSQDERSNGDVHVINVSVPMYVPNLHEEYRPTKPPDYEQIVGGDEAFPPPYDEAVKLRPSEFFGTPTPSHQGNGFPPGAAVTVVDMGTTNCCASHYTQTPCQPSPSHHQHHRPSTPAHHIDLSRALLLDHQENESYIITSTAPTPTPIPTPRHIYLKGGSVGGGQSGDGGEDPPPAYEPSPRPSISSCSSFAPLIPTSMSRFDLPPSFSVRQLFGGGALVASSSPRDSPVRRRESNSNILSGNLNEHLHDQVINEDDATLSTVAPLAQLVQPSYMPSLQLGNTNTNGDSNSDNININGNF